MLEKMLPTKEMFQTSLGDILARVCWPPAIHVIALVGHMQALNAPSLPVRLACALQTCFLHFEPYPNCNRYLYHILICPIHSALLKSYASNELTADQEV